MNGSSERWNRRSGFKYDAVTLRERIVSDTRAGS